MDIRQYNYKMKKVTLINRKLNEIKLNQNTTKNFCVRIK